MRRCVRERTLDALKKFDPTQKKDSAWSLLEPSTDQSLSYSENCGRMVIAIERDECGTLENPFRPVSGRRKEAGPAEEITHMLASRFSVLIVSVGEFRGILPHPIRVSQ
jgi:hypothetical protein